MKNSPDEMHADENLMAIDVAHFDELKASNTKMDVRCPTSPCVVGSRVSPESAPSSMASSTTDSFLHSMQYIRNLCNLGKHFISVWGIFGGGKSQDRWNKEVRMA